MATTIKLKNSVTTTNAPSSLVQGEVAINITDKKVWVGNAATTPIQLLGDGGSGSFTSIAFGAGTVSSPSITFTGDTNTGIYSPAADTIAFTEGGVESMRIDSSGNVGIGTSSPSGRLTLATASGSINALTMTGSGTAQVYTQYSNTGGSFFVGLDNSAGTGFGSAYSANLYHSGAYPMIFWTNSSERMRIDSSGNVGIGTSSPAQRLHVSTASGNSFLQISSGSNNIYYGWENSRSVASVQSNTAITFDTGGSYTERMRIDSSGRVGIGTSSPSYPLHVSSSGNNTKARFTNGTTILDLYCGGDAVYTGTANSVTSWEYDNNNTYIAAFVNSAERMRITSGGFLLVGKTSANIANAGVELSSSQGVKVTVNGDSCLQVNRLTSDGDLVLFRQDGTQEGSISVSGTTVSYNGGHLSRWSQLPSNQKDDTLLKGTVMSNLDDMCFWTKDGEVLPNEQLNKMKVSDVEGDTNVAGVFVNWTFDEQCQSDDMNVAMTGDMIIRIAQGVVVQKGDLLMSAGDGTAKPQGDDIVRSKTIAKVTSNHVTCTYADGSYCVPCVLMAC